MRAARVTRTRAAIVRRWAVGLNFLALTTPKMNFVAPLVPGATVRSIVVPGCARTRLLGPVTEPGVPVVPSTREPTRKPAAVNAETTSGSERPASVGTARSGAVAGLVFPARSVSRSVTELCGSYGPTSALVVSGPNWPTVFAFASTETKS